MSFLVHQVVVVTGVFLCCTSNIAGSSEQLLPICTDPRRSGFFAAGTTVAIDGQTFFVVSEAGRPVCIETAAPR